MAANEVVLILQIGSLGDTVISLPCYREIARRHPNADRYLLTNFPIGSKMVPAEAILKPTGVIIGSIEYPMPLRDIGRIWELHKRIRSLRPTMMYYLLPEKHSRNLLRHFAFFKACGIPHIHGVPWSRAARFPRALVSGALWESEASRLLRTIGAATRPPPDEDRDLALSQQEFAQADALLQQLQGVKCILAVSVGGKVPINDWGDDNWRAMLNHLWELEPSVGVVFVGSADERPRNDRLALAWPGRSLNTSGLLTPRETAALTARAAAFVGHDTGTLHLAGAADTPIVGVYSARNLPGKWFSDRERDVFFYNAVPCEGCELVEKASCRHNRICMTRHDPAAVAAAVHRFLPG